MTGSDEDGLVNLDVILSDLAEELNKEDGPRIEIIVDQKVSRNRSHTCKHLNLYFAVGRYD